MSDLIEKLWPAFHAESREQLDALELALVRDDAGAGADLHALFRHFHTLKGGCAMMGFDSMARIAHACEDLLDPVRRGERPLTVALVDALLAALDCLQGQLASVEATRADPAPAPELLARLQALLAPEDALPPADATSASAVGVAFAAAARDTLPGLCLRLLDGATGGDALLPALQAEAVQDGAPALAHLLGQLATASSRTARIALLGELLERTAWLEQEQHVDAGTEASAAALRAALETGFRAQVDALGRQFSGLLASGTTEAPTPALMDALDGLLGLAGALVLRPALRLLRLVRQALREWQRGSLVPAAGLPDLLHMAVALPGDLLPGLAEDAPWRAMCEQLHERLEQAIAASLQGEQRQRRVAVLQQQTGLPDGVLAGLDDGALAQLEAALARHETIVELEADPEAAGDAGRGLVDWLHAHGTLLGNYTVPHGAGVSARLCFLAALPLPAAEIRRQTAALDPRLAIVLRECGGPLAEVVPGSAGEGGRAAPDLAGIGSTLRIDSGAVDTFVNRVGEMVTLRNMLAHALYRDDLALRRARVQALLRGQVGPDAAVVADVLDEVRALLAALEAQAGQLQQADGRLQGALAHLQEEALALRVVPIALVFNRLPRTVRDLGQALGRQVQLVLTGEDVRIDKGMVDMLVEPLLHLVRNAIDHGIEPAELRRAAGKPERATLAVSARQQGNSLLVEIADDGRGLDHERIRHRAVANGLVGAAEAAAMDERELNQLIFLPGFSTAERVTDVSGRGVGMDAVRTRVLQLGGQVEVTSVAGTGTTFTLRLPLSAALQNVVLVEAGARQLALPERNVLEVVRLPADALQTVQGQACCLLRGVTLPLYRLALLLGEDTAARGASDMLEIVVAGDGMHRIGLVVDRIAGRAEVYLRDVHPDLVRLPGIGGASVLGDGRVIVILDCEKLFDVAVRRAQGLRTLLRAS